MKRPYLVAMLGTALEHYDSSLYSFMAPILVSIFLPQIDPLYGLIAAFCVQPLSILSRPVGAFVIGRIGDTYGRRQALTLSMGGMAGATLLIACLPTYAAIGLGAPLLFAGLRILQDFFVAGEYNGGAIFTLEHLKTQKRCLVSSLYCAATVVGILLASLAAMCVSYMPDGYWRLPYCLAFLTGIVALVLRRYTAETPEFKNAKKHVKQPLSFKHRAIGYKRAIFLAIFSTLFFATITKLPLTFMPAFISFVSPFSLSTVLTVNSISLGVYLVALPPLGYLADKIGYHKSMALAAIFTAVFTLPISLMFKSTSLTTIVLAKCAFSILSAWFVAPFHVWMQDLFAVQDRYTFISLCYAIGSRVGSCTPPLALFLWDITGSYWAPFLILAFTAIAGFLSVRSALFSEIDEAASAKYSASYGKT